MKIGAMANVQMMMALMNPAMDSNRAGLAVNPQACGPWFHEFRDLRERNPGLQTVRCHDAFPGSRTPARPVIAGGSISAPELPRAFFCTVLNVVVVKTCKK